MRGQFTRAISSRRDRFFTKLLLPSFWCHHGQCVSYSSPKTFHVVVMNSTFDRYSRSHAIFLPCTYPNIRHLTTIRRNMNISILRFRCEISVSQSNFAGQKHKTNLFKFPTLFIRKLNHLLLNVRIGYQLPALCNQFNVTMRLLVHVCNNCGHICIRYEIPPGNSGFGSLKLTQYIHSR